jgi:hypothetical protein
MPVLFTNNATTTLGSSLLVDATSLTVSSSTGALFPTTTSGFFYVALVNSSNQIEFVKVTARTSDTFTIVRAQNGSTARPYAAGDKVELRLIAAALENFVQLDGAQTVTGAKTFSGAVTLSGGGAISGTYTGGPTFSGAPVFSGAVSFSGAPTFSGNPTFSGTPVFSNSISLTGGSLNTTNFKIMQESGKLVVKYGTTVILSISPAGDITALADVVGYGTP